MRYFQGKFKEKKIIFYMIKTLSSFITHPFQHSYLSYTHFVHMLILDLPTLYMLHMSWLVQLFSSKVFLSALLVCVDDKKLQKQVSILNILFLSYIWHLSQSLHTNYWVQVSKWISVQYLLIFNSHNSLCSLW